MEIKIFEKNILNNFHINLSFMEIVKTSKIFSIIQLFVGIKEKLFKSSSSFLLLFPMLYL